MRAHQLGLFALVLVGCAGRATMNTAPPPQPCPVCPAEVPAVAASTSACAPRVAERNRAFETLASNLSSCGGLRTSTVFGRVSLVLPADCFFTPDGARLSLGAFEVLRRLASVLGSNPERHFLLGVHSPSERSDAGPASFRSSAQQAAMLVQWLVEHAHFAPHKLAAVGFGEYSQAEVYDGPAQLAPGNHLLEVVWMPSHDEDAACR